MKHTVITSCDFFLLAQIDLRIIAVIMLIAGPLLAFWCFDLWRKKRRIYKLMRKTQTGSINQLTEGTAEICGRAAISEEPLISPWGKQKCIHYCFHAEAHVKTPNGDRWETLIIEEDTLPFIVNDNTGQVVVDSSKIEFDLKTDKFFNSSSSKDEESDLERLLHYRYAKTVSTKFRCTETSLKLDEEVYVFGSAMRLGKGWVLRDGIMPLIISDKGGAAVEKNRSNQVIIDGILALVFAAVGCAGLFMLGAGVSKANNELPDVANPLHDAAYDGQKQTAELLIVEGANVNAKNEVGRTPLHLATGMGRKEIVKLLITKEADVNAKDNDGKTPLDEAVDEGHTVTADLLRKHGGKTGEELKAEGK